MMIQIDFLNNCASFINSGINNWCENFVGENSLEKVRAAIQLGFKRKKVMRHF